MSVIYEDEYVTVTDSLIYVKNYHFPSRKIKKVSIEAVSVLYFEDQNTCRAATTTTWGKSSASIHWALDMKRDLRLWATPSSGRANVVIDIANETKIGFSVIDIDAFMEAMREVLDYHVIIVDSINL